MKFYGSGLNFVIFICLCIKITSLHAAAIICNDESTTTQAALNTDARVARVAVDDDDNSSAAIVVNKQTMHDNKQDGMITAPTTVGTGATDVKQFLQTVQCTLEKAKPWVATIEQEAKRIEETAKRVGAGIINSFSDLMESWMKPDPNNNDKNNNSSGPSSSIIGSSALSLLNGLLANVAGVNENQNAAAPAAAETHGETANVAIAENAAE